MFKLLTYATTLIGLVSNTFCQSKIADIELPTTFQKNNTACGYFLDDNTGYIINFQNKEGITRSLYDANYRRKNSYFQKTEEIALDNNNFITTIFASDLQLSKAVYEIYSGSRKVVIVAPDFEKQKDSIVYLLDLKEHEKDEKRLAIIPFSNGLRILSFSNKQDRLYLYQWTENGQTDTTSIELPESTLSAAEIKLYTKESKIKYKTSFASMTVAPAGSAAVIGSAGITNSIFYANDKIWLLSQTPLSSGYNLLELDIPTKKILSYNFIVNDWRKNLNAANTTLKVPYAAIIEDKIVIRNSSDYLFQYIFYDLATKEKLKEYTAGPDESLNKVIHSDFNQKGTWLSGADNKKLENEKAFLRKLSNSEGFTIISGSDMDSITITNGSIERTSGAGGLLLGVATGMIGGMANITIGNFQIIPYLTLYRNKLFYSHSRFSRSTLEPSTASNITTTLDDLLNNFEKRELSSKSSFLMKKSDSYFIAVYNKDVKKLELHRLIND